MVLTKFIFNTWARFLCWSTPPQKKPYICTWLLPPQTSNTILLLERNKVQYFVYYTSQILTHAQWRYPTIDKLDFTLKMVVQKIWHYFCSHIMIVLTLHPLKNVLVKPKVLGSLVHTTIELDEYDIEYMPKTFIKT